MAIRHAKQAAAAFVKITGKSSVRAVPNARLREGRRVPEGRGERCSVTKRRNRWPGRMPFRAECRNGLTERSGRMPFRAERRNGLTERSGRTPSCAERRDG